MERFFQNATPALLLTGAGVQPQWSQGFRSGDGIGEDQETIAYLNVN